MSVVAKWFYRWIGISAVIDIGLIWLLGWSDFIAAAWWKSLPMAFVVIALWFALASVVGQRRKPLV